MSKDENKNKTKCFIPEKSPKYDENTLISPPILEKFDKKRNSYYTGVTIDELVYYDNIEKQTKDLSHNMRSFHNNIKRMLICSVSDAISRSLQNNLSLLDLACGQLGDLYKWYDAYINFVWGIEINKNNLYKKDGAINRYKNFLTQHNKNDLKVKLTCADASLPIKISKPFNIVSCQFALNYFLETPEKLNGLLNNVTNALRPGGYFIGTVIDGQSVYNLLSNGKDKISGITDDNDLMWEIIRVFPNDQPFQKYGQAITMYMSSIGDKPITEYLVNFDYIIEKCHEYNLELVTSELFDSIYNNIKQPKDIRLEWNYKFTPLSDQEKQLSFLNRYFIFIKK